MGLWSSKPKNPPPQFTGTSVSPQNVNGMVEVFFKDLEPGKCYFTAEYEKKVGRRYFVSRENLRYVGKYKQTVRTGWGDGAPITSEFEKGNVENSYGGYTCFVEDPSCSGDVSKVPVMTAPIGGKRKKTKKKVRRYKH